MAAAHQHVYVIDDSADYRFLIGQVFKRFMAQFQVHLYHSGTAFLLAAGVDSLLVKPTNYESLNDIVMQI